MELAGFLRLYRHLARYDDAIRSELESVVAGRALDGASTRTLRILRDEILPDLDAAGVGGVADLMFEIDHFLRGVRTGKGA